MIRIGIVGCGRILAAHLRGYRLLREAGVDDFRITALCARRESDAAMYIRRGEVEQRPAVSDMPGDPLAVSDEYLSDFQDDVEVKIYTDYRQMIQEGPIDAVNDFSLHSLHHLIAAEAFACGKDLLTQKPLAATVAAARQMVQQAEATGRVLGVFENARNRAATRQLHWLFHGGVGGKLQMILLGNFGVWWAPDQIVAETPWRHRLDEAGGLTLDIGVHQAHVVRYLGGEIASVQGSSFTVEPKRYTRDAAGQVVQQVECDADDTFFASLETVDGVRASLNASWAGHGAGTLLGKGLVFYGSKGRVTGDELSLDGQETTSLNETFKQQADAQTRERFFPLGLEDAFALNQYDWLQAIRDRSEPETNGREGLRDLAAAYAILESSHAGRKVDVDEVESGELGEFQKPLDARLGF